MTSLVDKAVSEADGLEMLDRLALQRRADAEAAAERPQPTFVSSIRHTEAMFTFRIGALPYSLIDPTALRDDLRARFDLSIGHIDLAPLLDGMTPDSIARLSEDEILRRLVRADDSQLTFESGKFAIRHGFVPIRTVVINFESILVAVEGVGTIADVVAQEIAERMWLAAGAAKRWEEIAPSRELMSFGTSTRIQLPFPSEDLLAPAIRRFLAEEVVDGRRFASAMGPMSRHDEFQPSATSVATATLDELHIQVDRFDTKTGYRHSAVLKFSVTARSDHGTGRLLVSSHLPYDQHIELLQLLLAEFESSASA